jgi:hypothetical protein
MRKAKKEGYNAGNRPYNSREEGQRENSGTFAQMSTEGELDAKQSFHKVAAFVGRSSHGWQWFESDRYNLPYWSGLPQRHGRFRLDEELRASAERHSE